MRAIPQTRLAALALTVVLPIAASLPIRACQICIPFPKKSAADFLIGSDAVVLAREDPRRPFHFAAVEVLKGDPDPGEIDLFLDSATRRLLAAYPERSVVLVRTDGGEDAGWRRVGIAAGDFAPLVRDVLEFAPDWQASPKRRTAFFATKLGHEDAQVRTLAHLEVARSPYGEIRRLGGALPRERLRAFLADFRYIEWHPLYILLLAQSEHPEDRALIEDSLRSAAEFGIATNLAAWATALIEIEGAAALDLIETHFLRDADRKPEELREIVLALSVHGAEGHTHLRDRIVAAYGTLLAGHPEMARHVADDLIAWRRNELAEPLAKYLAANRATLDLQTSLRLRAYIRRARGGS